MGWFVYGASKLDGADDFDVAIRELAQTMLPLGSGIEEVEGDALRIGGVTTHLTNLRRAWVEQLAQDRVPWYPVRSRRPRVQALIRKARADVGGPQAVVNNVGAGVRGRSWSDVFHTVTTKSIGQFIIVDGDRCRMPTVREIARAQGFPDCYPLPPQKDLAGKLVGNAIPPTLAAACVAAAVLAAGRRSRGR